MSSRWSRWFGFLSALFVVDYFIGLVSWIYDEASYGGQPWFQPFEFVGFGGICALIAWRLLKKEDTYASASAGESKNLPAHRAPGERP